MILYSSFFRAQYGAILPFQTAIWRGRDGAVAYDLRENVNLSVGDRDGARMVCRRADTAPETKKDRFYRTKIR